MTAAAKAELRRQVRDARNHNSHDGNRAAYGTLWPEVRAAALDFLGREPDRVLGFQPMTQEPDIRDLLASLLAEGASVHLPRTEDESRLSWIEANTGHLESKTPGIPMPAGPVTMRGAEACRNAVVLVPALAVDTHTGLRMGQGGGYYDRLMSQTPADARGFFVAVVFSEELVDVPREGHDQHVDAVLTERGLRLVD